MCACLAAAGGNHGISEADDDADGGRDDADRQQAQDERRASPVAGAAWTATRACSSIAPGILLRASDGRDARPGRRAGAPRVASGAALQGTAAAHPHASTRDRLRARGLSVRAEARRTRRAPSGSSARASGIVISEARRSSARCVDGDADERQREADGEQQRAQRRRRDVDLLAGRRRRRSSGSSLTRCRSRRRRR